jgi:hypothetical protein
MKIVNKNEADRTFSAVLARRGKNAKGEIQCALFTRSV